MVFVMEIKSSIMPVHVRVRSNVSVSVNHVCGVVHLLLVVYIVERLPVMVGNKLLGKNALDAGRYKMCSPGGIQQAE